MHDLKPVRVTFGALAAAAALALSACGSDSVEQSAPPAMTTVSESAGNISQPSPSASSSLTSSAHASGSAAGQTSSNQREDEGNCGVDPNASAITDNISQVPAPSLDGLTWTYKGDSNYDKCATLSYATVEQSEQGNSQFQNQLMLFHKGEYLGVGSDTVQQHQVIATTDDSVTVRYKDWEALDTAGAPNAEASNYTTDVTFTWDGSRVVPQGRFPNLSLG
jgi:hypothetical protein